MESYKMEVSWEALAAELKKQVQVLEQRSKGDSRWRTKRKKWEEVRNLLPTASQRPFALVNVLKKLHQLSSDSEKATVQQIEEWVFKLTQEHLRRYGELLREELTDCSIDGRFPEYRINNVLDLRLDERKNRAIINTSFCRETVNEISVPTVAEKVREQLRRLFDRPFDPQAFLDQLYKAYRLALVQEGKPSGEVVNIFTAHKFAVCLRQSAKVFTDASARHFQPYLPDEFAIDLGKLLQSGITQTPQGYQLKLHPVRNPKEALFVVNFATGRGQNYGLVSFHQSNN